MQWGADWNKETMDLVAHWQREWIDWQVAFERSMGPVIERKRREVRFRPIKRWRLRQFEDELRNLRRFALYQFDLQYTLDGSTRLLDMADKVGLRDDLVARLSLAFSSVPRLRDFIP
jgi:hypothetical protein